MAAAAISAAVRDRQIAQELADARIRVFTILIGNDMFRHGRHLHHRRRHRAARFSRGRRTGRAGRRVP